MTDGVYKTDNTDRILDDICTERARQDHQWGGAAHDDQHNENDWNAYITRFLGRALTWEPSDPVGLANYRRDMIKVAALAVAAIEWADRLAAEGE